jgi:probable selenium-dependent hydroxylase accessory protein YqeC
MAVAKLASQGLNQEASKLSSQDPNQDTAKDTNQDTNLFPRLLLTGPNNPHDQTPHKIASLPTAWLDEARAVASPDLIWLVEADGSARKPIKAHRETEPVLPQRPYILIIVIGLSGLKLPWSEAIHRPEQFELYQKLPDTQRPLKPLELANFAAKAYASLAPDLIFLNQADSLGPELKAAERELATALVKADYKVVAGSLFERQFYEY